jgi:hypothetical protein
MTQRMCRACGYRPAAHGEGMCLACFAAGVCAPLDTANESDPRAVSRLATTLHGNPRACERCGGPVRCVNTFSGAGFYRCTLCGHESETAGERGSR